MKFGFFNSFEFSREADLSVSFLSPTRLLSYLSHSLYSRRHLVPHRATFPPTPPCSLIHSSKTRWQMPLGASPHCLLLFTLPGCSNASQSLPLNSPLRIVHSGAKVRHRRRRIWRHHHLMVSFAHAHFSPDWWPSSHPLLSLDLQELPRLPPTIRSPHRHWNATACPRFHRLFTD
jgi:hypothetical protein